MNRSVLLTVTSLLSALLVTFHIADDIVRGMDAGGLNLLLGVLIFVVWLYGALVLAGRRSGYIIMLLGAILGAAVPILHMRGAGLVGGKVAPDSAGAFFWVWNNIALDVVAVFTIILAARCLWNLQWAKTRLFNE